MTNLCPALAIVAGLTGSIEAASFTVSQDGRGAFSSIQKAVDKAGKGDIIEILDASVYAEQVTIDSTKNGLILRSSNPTAPNKPVIQFQDRVNVGPTTAADSKIESKINFDQNGALRIMRARNVTIDGIAVDGAGPYPFAYPGIWNSKDPLFHGNGAITVWISGDVVIRNCDIRNAYIGINVKDRNEGGIFANANPADIQPWNVVPLSGFGKTGNHLFEKNRIHGNSWGMFFESAWDLGSNIRYNLFYENHHATPALSAQVAKMPDGANQPGGALFFKDVLLSPVAIYNNTFWHNNQLISGHWQAGAQHLLFNNIYASPYQYWSLNKDFTDFQDMDGSFGNRTKNCIYATQIAPPVSRSQTYNAGAQDTALNKYVSVEQTVTAVSQVRIMNKLDHVENEGLKFNIMIPLSSGPVAKPQVADWVIQPGALITSAQAGGSFPPEANVRWYEIKFKSTDPASPDFLSPDWDDSVVQKYVKDAGWPASGVRDADGSLADLGAISSTGIPVDEITVKPLAPVIINATTATLSFTITGLSGRLDNPRVKMLGWQNNLDFQKDIFGSNAKPLPPSMDMTSQAANAKIETNGSTFTITVPVRGPMDYYAFAEIILEGTGSNGKPIVTNVGFLPFRKLDYKFLVEILDNSGKKITAIKVGETANLKITPQSLNGSAFNNTIAPVTISLNSGADFLTSLSPNTKLTVDGITGPTAKPAIFTKVPIGGLEFVTVAGIYKQGTNSLAFYGVSEGVKILPGDPEKIVFQDPPSKILNPGSAPVLDPGMSYPVKLEVRDRFDNAVSAPVTVSIKSNQPAIGNIDGALTATTDSSGMVQFAAKVTNGDLNQIFELEASIPGKPADKADLKVGKARDKFWVLYADVAAFDPAAELRGSAGERLAVTIRAGKDANTKLADRQTDFKIDATPGLAVFASAADAAPATAFKLVNGEAVVYVTGLLPVENGSITVSPVTDNTILAGARAKIFFTFTAVSVSSASFHADNGFAKVDRVEIFFRQDLKRSPDSLKLSWPAKDVNALTVKDGITLDPANPKHITVKLAAPFPEGLSGGVGAGTLFTYDPATPDIPVQATGFTGADSVGPLLDSAKVQEKIGPGGDTLFVAFNEKINPAGLEGASLILIRAGGAPVTLAILSPLELAAGKGYRLSLADLGAQAPAEGDSLKINPAGRLTDAAGNHSHPDNRPVALRLKTIPKPPVLTLRMDRPLQSVQNAPQGLDFIILSPNPDSSWTPVQGSLPNGGSADCRTLACGDKVRGDATGAIDRPAFTVETDRGIKYSVTIFTNLGEFVNGFDGEITNAQLGLDEHNLPASGAASMFRKNAQGRFPIKISWNARAHDDARAATGVYIAKVTATSRAEDIDGKPYGLAQSKAIRFGLMRR